MRKKILLAVLICVMAASFAFGESTIFVEYPTLGECKGDNVRIRTSPNKNSEVIGKLNEYDKIIVLRKVTSKNGVWYEVDNPTGEGEAYIFGKYLVPAYKQKFQRSKGAKILTEMRLTYGSTFEKMQELSDEPGKLTRRDNDGIHSVIVDLGDYRVFYRESEEGVMGYLKSMEIKSGNKSFGNIHIGDSTEKLRRELGDPKKESSTSWEYDICLYGYHEGYVEECVDACIFRFSIEDGKISRMYYYNREDGEDGEEKW